MGESQWNSKAEFDAQPAYTTGDQVDGAIRNLAFGDTAFGLAARVTSYMDMSNIGGTALTPEQANERYPGMPTPFRDPVKPAVAQMLYDREQEKQQLQQAIQNGPQDPWQRAKNFGAGIIAHMMDPVEFGIGAATGWGIGAGMARTAVGVRAAAAAEGGSLVARTALGATEAFSGNLIQNTVQEAASQKVANLEGVKYDPVEGMKNIAVSTLIGGIVGTGIKEGSYRFTRFLNNTSPEADLAIARATKGQYEAGLKPDATPILTAIAKETDVSAKDFPDKFQYQYDNVGGDLSGKKFYMPTGQGTEFNPDNNRMIGDQHGLGPQMTDNPGVANAAANRAFADKPGQVWEIEAKDLRPFDLDQKVPPELHEDFAKALGGSVDDFKKTFESMSGRQIMDAVFSAIDEGDQDAKAVSDLQDALKGKGFNAFMQDGSSVAGVEHSPHNLITPFDRNSYEPRGFREIDPEVRNDPTPQDIRDVLDSRNDPKSKDYVNGTTLDNANKLLEQADREGLKFEPPEEDKDFFDTFKSMEDQGLLDESMAKEVEAIKQMDQDAEFHDKLMRAVMGCVRG
jgi:hypothetical protein